MPERRCPRCDAVVDAAADSCPACDMSLRDAQEANGVKRTSTFLGLPRFLKKEEPDWEPPEVPLPGARWPRWLFCFVAGLLLWVYSPVLRQAWNRVMDRYTEGEVSIKILPPDASSPSRPDAGADWAFSGKVYDLVSLKPVAAAELVFEDLPLNKRFTVSSDANGSFHLRLPKASTAGYYLKVRCPGHIARPLIEEGSGLPRLKAMDMLKRKALGEGFARTILPFKPFAPRSGRAVHLFLVPDED